MTFRAEHSCPLPNTHNRLRQLHDLWHEMQAAYPDADAFVTKLNSCLITARSVTFVLQKELKRFPWFDGWYAPWQDRMRADPLMRWLVKARNAVEKEGDLDTESVAIVSLLLTGEERVVAQLEVPPLASPAEVAEAIKLSEVPERVRNEAVMEVERRWTVPELPEGELLDTLAHCYGVLAEVVRGAHERRGVRMQTFGGEEHGARHARRPHPSGRLPCMVATTETRTAYWHLRDGTLMEYDMRTVEVEEEALDGAADHYGIRDGEHGLAPGQSPHEHGRAMHSLGKRMLKVDGYHRTMAWLVGGHPDAWLYTMDAEDPQDKVVKVRRLAQEVDRAGVDAVLFTSEAWIAPQVDEDDPRAALRPGDRDDRREMLATYLLRREGDHAAWLTPFGRDDGGSIVLGETNEQRDYVPSPFFAPVLRVWESWPEPEPEPEP